MKGSGRSIEEYNLFCEINIYKELLNSFGGHAMAAGMSIRKENLKEFIFNLNKNSMLTEDDFIEKIYLDNQLKANEITFDIIEDIEKLEPYGKGNSKPIFGDKNIVVQDYNIIGKNKNAMKFKLDARGRMMEGIYFGDIQSTNEYLNTKFIKNKNNIVDIVFYPSINKYNGNTNIQLIIKDIR